MSLAIAVCTLSIPKVIKLLTNPDESKVSYLPPVKPKGGEIYLFRARNNSEKDDWRSDQYRWVNQGVHALPKKDPIVRKSYYQLQTPEGPNNEFTKHAYQLLSSNADDHTSVTLIHYIGNEKVAVQFPHGNEKHNQERPFIRTCPSVLRNLESSSRASCPVKGYKSAVTTLPASSSHLPVLQPRNYKQVENYRRKHLQNQRISYDSLYSLHQIAYGEPNFIHSIQTFPDFICVFGQQAILNELDRVLLIRTSTPQLFSYDTTFQLGDFYVSILNFRHTLFKEAPVIPALFMLHERKYQQHHEDFLRCCLKSIPSLKNSRFPIVTDEERGIVNAISNLLPLTPRLRCWNHTFRDIKTWLRKHGASAEDIVIYKDDVRKLLHSPSEAEYADLLEQMAKKRSAPFLDYFRTCVNPDVHSLARWAIEVHGVYDPFSGVTNNQSESLNFVIKQLQEWREAPIDSMVLSMNYLQSFYNLKILRGKRGLGNYHMHSQYSREQLVDDDEPILVNVFNPEDIVKRIRSQDATEADVDEIDQDDVPRAAPEPIPFVHKWKSATMSPQCSQKERAKRLLESKKISFDPMLHTFTIIGESDIPYVVRLFQYSCSCPGSPLCYHIMAAKMSIGMELKVERKKINLTQLRHNVRIRLEKKSGRKKPRPRDYDVQAAPDACGHDSKSETLMKDQLKSASCDHTSSNTAITDDDGNDGSNRPNHILSSQIKDVLLDEEFYKLVKDLTKLSEPASEEFDDDCHLPQLDSSTLAEGEFFLHIDAVVNLWLMSLEDVNKPHPRKLGNFVVMDHDLEKEYDSFKMECDDKCFLPENDLLHFWHDNIDLSPCKNVSKFGKLFVELTYAQIDDFYLWFMEKKSNSAEDLRTESVMQSSTAIHDVENEPSTSTFAAGSTSTAKIVDIGDNMTTVVHDQKERKRRRANCGTCVRCCQRDCGTCSSCHDMVKFGGPGRKKKRCEARTCIYHENSLLSASQSYTKGTKSSQQHFNSLQFQKRKLVAVKGDGNCLFRALSHQLFHSEEHHLFLRTNLVRFERANSDLFQRYCHDSKSLADHSASMIDPYVWGTHVELLAAATMFKTKVYYFESNSEKWGVYKPIVATPPQKELQLPIIPTWPAPLNQVSHIEVAYRTNEHYDSVVDVDTGFTCIDEPQIPISHDFIDLS